MARIKGNGSIRQRANGRWEGRYTVGFDPITGKQKQKSIYGSTQAEVARRLREITKDIDDGIFVDDQNITVGQWLTTWVNEYTIGLKTSTKRSYATHIQRHIIPALGKIRLSELTPSMIQKFYTALLKNGRVFPEGRTFPEDISKGLSPKTVKNVHTVLHKALKQATRPPKSLIKYNPADAVELPRAAHVEMRALTKEEVSALLISLKDDWHYPIFYVALFCGLRRGELLGLRWSDIDFRKQTITVSYQLQRQFCNRGTFILETPKNNKSRTIFPPSSVFDVLREHKILQDALRRRMIEANEPWQDTNAVFCGEHGGWLEPSSVYRALQKHLARIGVKGVRLHDLRHTFATNAIDLGIDIKTIQETLGHADPGFTLRVYGHSLDEMKRKAAEKMQSLTDEITHNNPTCK